MIVQQDKKVVDLVHAISVDENGEPVLNDGFVVIKDPDSGIGAKVDDLGQLHTVLQSKLCNENSTLDLLSAIQIFTGTPQNLEAYNGMAVFVTSDVIGFLEVQFSKDGLTRWRTAESYIVQAGAEKWFTPPTFGIYFRLVYTNGVSDQTDFEITTKLSKTAFKWSSHNIDVAITDQDDAELIKAVITGKKANGEYDNVSLTNGGNMKTSLEELESGISENSNTQLKTSPFIIDEFGNYAHVLGDNIFKGSIIAIPPEHHEIHCGDSYEGRYTGELSKGASVTFAIVIPDEGIVDPVDPGKDQSVKLYHAKMNIDTEAEATVAFYEDAVAAPGTVLEIMNKNRNSSNTDILSFSISPVVTSVGNLLPMSSRIGSGKSIGGDAGREEEMVLKNDSTYLITITNATTSSIYYNIHFDYYVHPGV